MATPIDVALVTGGASGMGRIIARRLAAGGAKVAILDVNEEGLAETARWWDTMKAYPCDVSDLAKVRETIAAVEEDLGPIDRLVHAAAIMPTRLLADSTPEEAIRLMRINYEGTVHVVLEGFKRMKARGRGELVIFGSLAGHVLTPELGAYCATKSAVNSFAEIFIEENRGSGVHTMLVCPPMTNTPLLEQPKQTSNPKWLQAGLDQGRAADPHDIVEAIEKGLEAGEEILFPGLEAKILFAVRRAAPKLLWKVIWKTANL